MASLFRFFAFAALSITLVLVWAYFDFQRNRRKASSYIRERLGIFGDQYTMTRFVNMARIAGEDPDRFIAVFFRRGKHLEIRDFRPDRVIDLPPDGVVLSDTARNQTRIFVERGKRLFSLKMDNFAPGDFCTIKKGTGGVKFGGEEIPFSNKDWFLIDRKNGRSCSPPLRETEPFPGEGLYFYEGFAPTEGFLLDEDGGVLMIDENNLTAAFRESSSDPLRLYGPDDIISVEPSAEDPDVLDFKVRDKSRPEFSCEFEDAGEARFWMDWFLGCKKEKGEKGEKGVTVSSRFVALPLLQNV
ncbi:MAG: hypothetical protein Q7I97_08190 [Thermovirgaceae bacterium]|nr:hypothetical protein [Thermovirgaceae bacterium]